MSEEITRLEQTVRDLKEAKLAKAQAREEQISAECRALGYQVHVEGKGRKQLDALIAEQVGLKAEIESLTGAIEVAGQKLEAAKAAKRAAEDRAQAEELREVVKRASERARKIDAALETAVAEMNELFRDVNSIHLLGSEFPTHLQVRQNVAFAVKSRLAQLPNIWKGEFDLSGAMLHGRTFVGFLENFGAVLDRDISRRLGETQSNRTKQHETTHKVEN